MNVLLIEPDQLLGNVYKKSLEKAGHEVAVVKGAQEAVAQADKTTPEVVILELQLPGHSGVEFLYEFRSYTEWQSMPIVLHTFIPEQNISLPSLMNIQAHLYKPATKLRQLVRTVNDLAPAHRESR